MHPLSVIVPLAIMVTSAIAHPFSTGPSLIRVIGRTNSSIDGYAILCNAGTGGKGLCYYDHVPVNYIVSQFYYNYSIDNFGTRSGIITYNLNLKVLNDTQLLHLGMQLQGAPGSNINPAGISPDLEDSDTFWIDDNDNFYIGNIQDDTYWNETTPSIRGDRNLSNFHLCWQWVGSFWHYSISWATTLPPQNPSCQPIDLRLVVNEDSTSAGIPKIESD
ncbi:hypothetical protein F5Y03DRAFT_394081 [Xylaria venustula]|nr:hypothetical protein F5Y03DRAFT_394081 [Xylaria venustula]